MPSWMAAMADPSTKVAVPTWTAEQPATRNSRASSAVAMPPIPTTGMRTERAAWWARGTAARPPPRPPPPAGPVGEPRPAGGEVDRHPDEGVDGADRVRPLSLDRP